MFPNTADCIAHEFDGFITASRHFYGTCSDAEIYPKSETFLPPKRAAGAGWPAALNPFPHEWFTR